MYSTGTTRHLFRSDMTSYLIKKDAENFILRISAG